MLFQSRGRVEGHLGYWDWQTSDMMQAGLDLRMAFTRFLSNLWSFQRSRQRILYNWLLLMLMKFSLPRQMNNCEHFPFVMIFQTVKIGRRPTCLITLIRFPRLVCFGNCSSISPANFCAWMRMSDNLGDISESRSWVAQSPVSMPPQGGHIMSASVWKGQISRKSLLMYLSRLRLFWQTCMLCCSISILLGSMSLTMYSQKLSQRWMAIPPIPQKGSKMRLTFFSLNLCLRQCETVSGMTEYQLSQSMWMPCSNLEKRQFRLLKYLYNFLPMLYRSFNYCVP